MSARRLPGLLLFFLASGVAAVGCASPCQQVQQALCRCAGQTQTERSSCEDAASAQESLSPPTDAQFSTCEALLAGCEQVVAAGCEQLRTEKGKKACGLALLP
jgi:hypothetical protein